MRSLPKLLSILLALLMLLSVLTVAPISASAVDKSGQDTAVDATKTAKGVDSVVKTADDDDDDDNDNDDDDEDASDPDDEDETDPDDEDETDPTEDEDQDETLPAGDMAAPKSMTVENIDLFEDFDAEITTTYDDDGVAHEWSEYNYENKIFCTVTLEDGSKIFADENGNFCYNGVDFRVDFSDDQDYKTPWGVGAHEVTFSILGLETTATVTVNESPISKVEFEDFSCVAGTHGDVYSYYTYNDETDEEEFVRNYFHYDIIPVFTVYLKDGSEVKSEDGAVEMLGDYYFPSISIEQHLNPLKAGTHKIPVTFCGKKYSYDFVIKPSDIKSISVEDVTIHDGVDVDYYITMTEEGQYVTADFDYDPTITITLTDGTVVTQDYSDDELTVGDNTYDFFKYDGQDSENEWTPGVYNATIFVGDVSDDFTVTLVASPIAKLEVSDVQVFDGLDTSDIYTTVDEEEYKWTRFEYTPEFTVTLKSGEKLTSTKGYVIINDEKYRLATFDSQDYNNVWEAGSTYTVEGRIGSVSDKFEVSVRDDAVSKIEVSPATVTVTKGVDSYFTEISEEGEESYERIYYQDYVNLKITMYDGTVVTADDNGYYYYKDYELPVEFIDAQSKDNVWDVGTHNATVAVLGKTAPITVNVKDTPAAKVEFSKVTIIEGTHRSSSESDYSYIPKYTVTLKNGDVLESDEFGGVDYNDEYFDLYLEDDQSETNRWGVGTHTATGTILGVSAEFEVEVVETPVEKIEAAPVQLIALATGDWVYSYDPETEEYVDKFFMYTTSPTVYTVTLKNGDILTSDEEGYVYYNDEWYGVVDLVDNQSYENQWTKGNTYKCTASVLGFGFEFEATVGESPVVSVQIDDLVCIDLYDCETMYDDDGEPWTRYNYDTSEASITVTLDDGTVIHGDYGTVNYNGEYYELTEIDDGQSPDNQWKVGGTYAVNTKIMGFDTTFNVRVVENPIKSIKVNDVFKINEFDEDYGYYEGYYDEDDDLIGTYFYYNPTPVNYTVTFKDGAVMKSDEDGYIEYNDRAFWLSFNYELTDQDYYNQWTAGGTYTAVATVMGFDVEYDVTINSKAPTTITLKAKKSKIYVGDKTTVTAKVTNPVGKTTFKSSNTKIATVDSKGNVKAKKAGKVKITATNNGKSKSVTITVVKKKNPAKIKASAKTVKYSKLQGKAQTVKAITVKKAQGKVKYTKVKGNKKITVNKKNGKITLKKGMKKGKYTIKVKVKAAGNTKYKSLTKTVKVTITVS